MDKVTETVSQNFEVGAAPALRLRNMAGNVRIAAGPDGALSVTATKKASSDEGLALLAVELRQDGDEIFVEGKIVKDHGMLNHLQRSIDFVITLPAATALDLGLNAGELDLRGTRGAAHIGHNAGNAEIADVTFTSAELNMNAGKTRFTDVTFSGAGVIKQNAGDLRGDVTLAAGARLELKLNAGSVKLSLPRETAPHLDAKVMAGDIHLDGFALTPRRRFVQVVVEGDLAPDPQAEMVIEMNAGNVTLSAR